MLHDRYGALNIQNLESTIVRSLNRWNGTAPLIERDGQSEWHYSYVWI